MQYFSNEKLNGLATKLRKFAEEQAKVRNLVFWNILRNKAIVSICKELPRSIQDLYSKKVLIGKKAIESYGAAIVSIVNEWCESDGNDFCEVENSVVCDSSIRLYNDGVITIKQGGFYYNVSGNDALIFHKYLGYKLYGVTTPRTGFPVSGQETVLKKLDRLSMDYDLLNQSGDIVVSKRFNHNCYEIINLDNAPMAENSSVPPKVQKRAFKKRLSMYISILQGMSEGVDVITGEVIEGLSEDVKLQLFEMSMYFDERLKSREAQDSRYPKHGLKWTSEEDEQLLSEYREGRTIKEISEIHNRSNGAIRSRLLGLGVLEHK